MFHLPSLAAIAIVVLAQAPATAQDSLAVRAWLDAHQAALGLTDRDMREWTVTGSTIDKKGVTYLYIRQRAHGLPVEGAVANFAVRHGQVVHAGHRLQADVHARAPMPAPGLSAEQALRHAAAGLELEPGRVDVVERRTDRDLVLAAGISRDPIPARLIHQVTADGRIALAWDLTVRSANTPNWWHVAVDAHTGAIVRLVDHVTACHHAPGAFGRPYSAMDDLARAPQGMGGGGEGSGYRVYAFPAESPSHGPHVLVPDPAHPVASPFGWHDTNGVPGAEYTITRGNNVHAGEDLDDDNVIGYSPDGGAGLLFDFPHDPPQLPLDYLDASIVNLFYTCNVLHDVWYQYGFDEASGNFQRTNHTGAGLGSDEVLAQAQDGGGMNNANFATPPDGNNGRMQMYLWRTSDDSTLVVNAPAAIADFYDNMVAGFGPPLPQVPITADVALAADGTPPVNDACEALVNAAAIAGKIAIVDRGICTFVSKVLALQAAGAVAVIVVNNVPGAPIGMGGDDDGSIVIPSVMVSMADGQVIKGALANGPVNATLQAAAMENLRDSSFDNGIIAHEYGHGVSIRLTGGASNSDCLGNDEQMGEGWSDWMGMVLTIRPGDTPATPRGVGTFVKDEENDGPGIRPAPYSTDFAINPYTYGHTNNSALSAPHGVGFVWATMLWDLAWDLIDVYGHDPDPYHGTGGNNMAIQLMMDGLKLQPCFPGFVDGRDAILKADSLNYDGVNSCLIWRAFADRGLGLSASQGSSFDRFDQVQAFDVPAVCNSVGVPAIDPPQGFGLAPNPADDLVTVHWAGRTPANAHLRLIAADGRVVRAWNPATTGPATFSVGTLAPGVYLVEARSGHARWQQRLVVQ